MTTACPCFGRNENCRLCNGTGLVISEVESKVLRSQESKSFVGTETLREVGRYGAEYSPLRETAAEKSASIKRKREADQAISERAALELKRLERDSLRNEENLKRRQLKEMNEAKLLLVLKEKRKAIEAGLDVRGPYRCLRCQGINEESNIPCYLCGAVDRYIEL